MKPSASVGIATFTVFTCIAGLTYECSRTMLLSTHTHNLSNVMARSVDSDG